MCVCGGGGGGGSMVLSTAETARGLDHHTRVTDAEAVLTQSWDGTTGSPATDVLQCYTNGGCAHMCTTYSVL